MTFFCELSAAQSERREHAPQSDCEAARASGTIAQPREVEPRSPERSGACSPRSLEGA